MKAGNSSRTTASEEVWERSPEALAARVTNFKQAIIDPWDSISKAVMEPHCKSIRGDKVRIASLPECIAGRGYQSQVTGK